MKRLIFDLETTGLNPAKHGIHQLSGLIEIDGEVVEEFDFKVKPNPAAMIDQGALNICGVTAEQIMAYEDMTSVFIKLTSILARYYDKERPTNKFFLVGYNNRKFDDDFLRGFFKQNGNNFFNSWFWSDSHDVMILASYGLKDHRHLMDNFKLSTVAKFLGILVDETKLHDATYDLYLTLQIEQVFHKINTPQT